MQSTANSFLQPLQAFLDGDMKTMLVCLWICVCECVYVCESVYVCGEKVCMCVGERVWVCVRVCLCVGESVDVCG